MSSPHPSSVRHPLALAALLSLGACGDPSAPNTSPAVARPSAIVSPCQTCPPTTPPANLYDVLFSRAVTTFQPYLAPLTLQYVHVLTSNNAAVVKLAAGDDGVWDAQKQHVAYAGYVRFDPPAVPSTRYVHRIFVMNGDGSAPKEITFSASAAVTDRSPAWSPDGTRIAFVSDRDGHDHLYVVNVDGSGLTQLTFDDPLSTTPTPDEDPAWSPDGKKLAYVHTVYGMLALGTLKLGVGPSGWITANADIRHPAWSPDGGKISFSFPSSGVCDIRVWDVAANAVSALSTASFPGISHCDDVRWSPNGASIVFTGSSAGFTPRVFRAGATDGANLTPLTDGAHTDHDTAWR